MVYRDFLLRDLLFSKGLNKHKDRFMRQIFLVKSLFILAGLTVLAPFVSPGVALLVGVVLALCFGNPFDALMRRYSKTMLALSVVGLGAGMNLNTVIQTGLHGFVYTAVSIVLVFAVGLGLVRLFKTSRSVSMLITVGTAICGGSAIAAAAPVLRAKDHDISVALACVFLLNALALFVFPWVGHLFDLSQTDFGLWAALAIHDTSSVVGAGLQYGQEALETATSVKLARALWIVPVTYGLSLWMSRQVPDEAVLSKPAKPWFIAGFLAMAALVTYLPVLAPVSEIIELGARRLMVLTLFFIGCSLSLSKLKVVGIRPFLLGVALWVLTAGGSLIWVVAY